MKIDSRWQVLITSWPIDVFFPGQPEHSECLFYRLVLSLIWTLQFQMMLCSLSVTAVLAPHDSTAVLSCFVCIILTERSAHWASYPYLLFLDLVLQGWDLDLHLLYLVLRQDLDAMTRVRVVQGLKGQVCQRDVPLALVLLMTSVHENKMKGSIQVVYNTFISKSGKYFLRDNICR